MKALGRIGKIVTTAAVSAILIGAAATAANAATPAPTAPATAGAPAPSTTPTAGSADSATTPASRLAAQATASGASTSPRPASGQRKVGDALQDWFAMVNNTPYVMHLETTANTGVMWWDGSKWEQEGWLTPPPQTLYPGQSATMAADPTDNMWVMYTFSDGQGHSYGFQGNDNPQNQVSGFSFSENAKGDFTPDISFFHVQWVPDTDQTIQAVLGKQVNIDASKNPGAAADAMTKLQLNNASNAFVPDLDAAGKPQIAYVTSAPVRASGELINDTPDQASLDDMTSTEWNQSTSFTESLTYEAQVTLFDAINTTLSAQFNSSQTLTKSSLISQDLPVALDPHQIGWLDQVDHEAQVTGTYTFVGTDGVTYHLLNVSVTLPSIGNPNLPGATTFDETPEAHNCTASLCPSSDL